MPVCRSLGRHLRFTLSAKLDFLRLVGVLKVVETHLLDGDVPVEHRVPRTEDDAVRTGSEPVRELVAIAESSGEC